MYKPLDGHYSVALYKSNVFLTACLAATERAFKRQTLEKKSVYWLSKKINTAEIFLIDSKQYCNYWKLAYIRQTELFCSREKTQVLTAKYL
jgi:hypothetical protein